eukprot:m.247065 g.247065  ORF g.247065 m.247065 type:complete len:68 (+) comp33854_c0_seq1:737-940(+)
MRACKQTQITNKEIQTNKPTNEPTQKQTNRQKQTYHKELKVITVHLFVNVDVVVARDSRDVHRSHGG